MIHGARREGISPSACFVKKKGSLRFAGFFFFVRYPYIIRTRNTLPSRPIRATTHRPYQAAIATYPVSLTDISSAAERNRVAIATYQAPPAHLNPCQAV